MQAMLILYPATSLHRVEPVTSGYRLAAFTLDNKVWSKMIGRRKYDAFNLDYDHYEITVKSLGDCRRNFTVLTNHYHNLLRQWGESTSQQTTINSH